jgi:O-antigen ligase
VALVPLAATLCSLPKTLHAGREYSFSLGGTILLLLAAIVLVQQTATLSSRPAQVSVLRHFIPATPFLWPALAFFAAATLATVAARFHSVALSEYRWVVVEPALFYWLVLQRLRGARDAALLALSVVAAGTVVSLLGAWQIRFRPGDLVFAKDLTPPQHFVAAVYDSQNNLALLIDRALPIALALVLVPGWIALFARGVSGARVWKPTRAVQAVLGLCSVIMAYILYRTGSRGGEATTLLCVAALFVLWQWRTPRRVRAAAFLVAAAAYLDRNSISAFVSGGHGLSNLAHQSIWNSALRMIRDHPILGIGPNNFLYYYSNSNACAPGHIANYYYVQAGTNFEQCISHPHNLFLDYWLSTGLLGLLTGLVMIGMFAWLGIRALRSADNSWKGPLLAALVAMLAFIAHGQVDNSYFLPDMALFFWLCLAIVTLYYNEATSLPRHFRDAASVPLEQQPAPGQP